MTSQGQGRQSWWWEKHQKRAKPCWSEHVIKQHCDLLDSICVKLKTRITNNPVVIYTSLQNNNDKRCFASTEPIRARLPWNPWILEGSVLYCAVFYLSWVKNGGPVWRKKESCTDRWIRGSITLWRVLVGALNPAGCSHTRLFVVFPSEPGGTVLSWAGEED